MEQITNEIRIGYSDPGINKQIASLGEESAAFSRHFNHSEEFFLKLESAYSVPHFPIHHDVRRTEPSPEYLDALRPVLADITRRAPQVLKGLTYFFDPAETLRPSFFQVLNFEEKRYLYLLRIDLVMKPFAGDVLERGTNDMTPLYSTRNLFAEAVLLPLEDVLLIDGRTSAFKVRQTISQTWIGERGRGYFIQGIWMDMDLTKFFSRLFLPAGARAYPFYPYLCKYKTVCRGAISLAAEDRRAAVPDLDRAIGFLAPVMEEIQAALRDASFDEDMPYFTALKARVPVAWYEAWKALRVQSYLNDAEMREFDVEG